jgi:hypothetical protein
VTHGSSSTAAVASSRLVLVTRLVLVAVAAGGLVAGLVVRRVSQGPAAAAATRPSFVCPMHPEVTSSSPGDCPICRMALEPMANVAQAAAEPAALKLATVEKELRAFDAVSRVKRFDTSQEMRSSAWAESGEGGIAVIYKDQAKLLVPGETGQFWPLGGSARGLDVRVGSEPHEPWDSATVRVRFHAAPGVTLPANGTGSVKFTTRLRHDLVVREGAVLRSPEGPYVLVATDDRHTLTKRRIEVGSVTYGYASVLSGLKEDEWVVALHAFALDTARRTGWRAPQ